MLFYVSFGYKYATQAHPAFVSGECLAMRHAHPNNWIEVEAPNQYEARQLVTRTLGTGWSMMYRADEWEQMRNRDLYFPGQCIARFSAEGVTIP